MLQQNAVYPNTFELLVQLMKLPALAQFHLVGGTALALQLGHRISVDLDLFSQNAFDTHELLGVLNTLGKTQVIGNSNSALNLFLNDVKIDIIHYPYPFIEPVFESQSIRFASLADIGAMKLWAIGNRSSKKDFFDLYELLHHFSLAQLFDFFRQKYPQIQVFHIVRSLTYFEDAENEPDLILLNTISWETVKQKMIQEIRHF